MPPIAGHVQAEELELFCLGGLSEVRFAHVEEHLFLCEICRDRLTETENYVAGMREASRQWTAEHAQNPAPAVVPIRHWRESWPGRLAPLSIAALLLIGALLWFGRHAGAPAPLPFAVALTAVRGAAPEAAPAGRPLLLELDLTGLGDGQPFAGEVVDAAGSRVARFTVATPTRVAALAPGAYFVRIYKTSGELLREYALTVKR
jgi:hypothetical protein